MRVGLLECDHVAEHHRAMAGDYRDMFERLLSAAHDHLEDLELVPYDACSGVVPDRPDECDAWLCTGSRQSVFDDVEWIATLAAFVRSIHDARAPYIGICFGHQLLAHALGGRVERAASGWGAGVHEIDVVQPEPWMDPPLRRVSLEFMHQDQVIEPPDDGEVLARTDHCSVAMMRVGESMIGCQAHPEFPAVYVGALLAERTERIGQATADTARLSLAQPTDEVVVARWIGAFLVSRLRAGTARREK